MSINGIQQQEKIKYDAIFQTLNPKNGKVPGDQVKPILIKSNQPIEVLGKVWELADIDKDGCLDREEFHIVRFFISKLM